MAVGGALFYQGGDAYTKVRVRFRDGYKLLRRVIRNVRWGENSNQSAWPLRLYLRWTAVRC
jgi:hypothetical protein